MVGTADDPPGADGVTNQPTTAPELPTVMARVCLASWSIVGVVAVIAIALLVLATISEVALPVLLGGVLAVVLKPGSDALVRRGLRPPVATAVVLLALLVILVGVAVAVVHGLVLQSDQINAAIDDAVAVASDELSVDSTALSDLRQAIADLKPAIGPGALTDLVSGVGSLVGFVSGLLLAMIVLYYLVKDGTRIRGRVLDNVAAHNRTEVDDFIGDSCQTLRSYGHGRTVLSAVVTAVMGVTAVLLGIPLVASIMAVTFVGGYVPYIGAFVAGAFTVLLALGDGGIGPAVVVLVVSLAANLLLENFVEPKVMGKTLDIHPLMVLIVTALGGLAGGLVGLIVAVPLAVIVGDAITRLRSLGHVERAAAKARPTAERLLGARSSG